MKISTKMTKGIVVLIVALFVLAPLTAFAANNVIVGPMVDIDSDSKQSLLPAVAYNVSENEYLVVWGKEQDQWTWDLWARRFDAKGYPLGNAFCVSTAPGERRSNPAIAYNPLMNQYLLVFEKMVENDWDIYAKRLRWDGGWMSDETAFTSGGGYHYMPAVAYNLNEAGYVIVWQNFWDNGVQDVSAAWFDINGASASSTLVASDAPNTACAPAVACMYPEAGGSLRCLIAFTYGDSATGGQTLRAKWVLQDLSDVGTSPMFIISPSYTATTAAVSTSPYGYLVSWSLSTPAPDQVRARRVTSDGVPLGSDAGFAVSGTYTTNIEPPQQAHANVRGFGQQLVAWLIDSGGPRKLMGRYVQDGALGAEFQISAGANDKSDVAVACSANGSCMVVSGIQDGLDWDIAGWIVIAADTTSQSGGFFVIPKKKGGGAVIYLGN